MSVRPLALLSTTLRLHDKLFQVSCIVVFAGDKSVQTPRKAVERVIARGVIYVGEEDMEASV